MYFRSTRLAIALLCAALLASGNAAAEASTHLLRLNQSLTLPGGKARVTFVYAHDARCPKDVQCLVAGDAYALLWFEMGTERKLLALAWPSPAENLDLPHKYLGYEFCFLSLEPKSRHNQVIRVRDRKLGFTVQQNTSEQSGCKATG